MNGYAENRQDILWRPEQAYAFQIVVANFFNALGLYLMPSFHPLAGGNNHLAFKTTQQFINQFVPFGYKKSFLITELLMFQTLDVFYVVFAEHNMSIGGSKDSYFSNLLFDTMSTFCIFENFMVYSIWAGENYII